MGGGLRLFRAGGGSAARHARLRLPASGLRLATPVRRFAILASRRAGVPRRTHLTRPATPSHEAGKERRRCALCYGSSRLKLLPASFDRVDAWTRSRSIRAFSRRPPVGQADYGVPGHGPGVAPDSGGPLFNVRNGPLLHVRSHTVPKSPRSRLPPRLRRNKEFSLVARR